MKIKVLNLEHSVSRIEIIELFENFGEVRSVKILASALNHSRSKIAIVEMDNPLDAIEAIEELHGEFHMGRHIQVMAENQILAERRRNNTNQTMNEDDLEDYWRPNFRRINPDDYHNYA